MPFTQIFPYTYTTPTSGAGIYGTFDWARNRAHLITAGPVLQEFVITSQVQLYSANLFPFVFNPVAMCTGADGYIYTGTSDSAHLVQGYNPATQLQDKTFNDVGHTLPAIGYVGPYVFGDQYVGCASLNSGSVGATVFSIDMSTMTWNGFSANVAEHDTSIVPGNTHLCGGAGFAVAVAVNGTRDVIGVYKLTTNALIRLGGLTPVAVDGSATFSSFFNPGYDFTDGNILLCVGTPLGLYILKLDSTTAAILWKVPVVGGVDLNEASIHNGVLQFVAPGGSPFHVYTINTLTGTVVPNTETLIPNFLGLAAWSDRLQMQVVPGGNSPGTANWATFGGAAQEDTSKIDALIEVGALASSEAVSKIDALVAAGGVRNAATMITPKIDAFVLVGAQLDTAKIDALVSAGAARNAATMVVPKIDAFVLVGAVPSTQHGHSIVDQWIGALT